jgi:hypothetical protein
MSSSETDSESSKELLFESSEEVLFEVALLSESDEDP